MRVKTSILLVQFLLLLHVCSGETIGQDTEAKALSTTEYRLSPAAIAAGLDGKLPIGLTINADGTAGNVRIYGGPMWPCGARMPTSEIEEVRKTVKDHILGTKFSPEVKDGKPRSVSAEITFLLSGRFKAAADRQQGYSAANSTDPVLIDVGPINYRAVTLPRPFYSGPKPGAGVTLLQILVDENGSVTSAGGFKGHPPLITAARDAACDAKFKPAVLNGKPVR